MFLFAVSVSLAVSCFQDLIAGPASPGLMLNAAAVWQWGREPESAATGWAAAAFCMRLRRCSKSPVHRRVLNVTTILIHKTSFWTSWKSYTEIRAQETSLLVTSTSRWNRFMTLFGSRNAGTEIGFFLARVAGIRWNSSREHHGDLGFPACCVTLDDILLQPTQAHCGCMTWVSTLTPQSAAYSGFRWQHVGHGMCSSLGVLKCVPRLTDCNSVWRAFFRSP